MRVGRSTDAPIKQIAADFGISDASLNHWLKQADMDDGKPQGVTSEADSMAAMKKRLRLLDQENEIRRCAAVFQAR